jgi:hypothetical protein
MDRPTAPFLPDERLQVEGGVHRSGSTANICRDHQDLFSELIECDESVVGVGGEHIVMTLKGLTLQTPWEMHSTFLVACAISYRSLI